MQRKKHDPAFKAKVALEVVRGFRTVNEIAADFGVHPNLITKWKRQLLDGLPGIFSLKGAPEGQDRETERLIASLYQKIGQLEVEEEWLKKNLCSCTASRRDLIEPQHPRLSIVRQCDLLGISRSPSVPI